MGKTNSLQALLKRDVPHLIIVTCVCHSLALCACYASSKLPANLDYLLRDIYSYFQYSFKRQSEFKIFQNLVNVKPHKMLRNDQTRWLSLLTAVNRVWEQYNALTFYFNSEYSDNNVKNAKTIFDSLSNRINFYYLDFLKFILPYIVD